MSWVKIQQMLMKLKPKKVLEPTGENKIRDFCIAVTETKQFDLFIMICILANTFILGFNWYM